MSDDIEIQIRGSGSYVAAQDEEQYAASARNACVCPKKAVQPATATEIFQDTPADRAVADGARWADAAQSRLNNFDVIRFVLALMVVLSHCFAMHAGDEYADPGWIATHGQRSLGDIAVDAFFAISGYLIVQSWTHSSSPRDYLKKRIARIYPAFMVATVVCFLIVGIFACNQKREVFRIHQFADVICKGALLDPVALPGSFFRNERHSIDGSMWTVKYEFWCYLFVAAAGVTGALRVRWSVASAFAASYVTYLALGRLQLDFSTPGRLSLLAGELSNWPRLLTFFLAGATFYTFRKHIPWSAALAVAALAALVVAARLPQAVAAAEPIAGTYLLLWFAFAPVGPYGFAKFGDFSYGIYPYSFPIQQMVTQYSGQHVEIPKLFLFSAPLSVLAAVLSWNCVERPFLKRARSASRVA